MNNLQNSKVQSMPSLAIQGFKNPDVLPLIGKHPSDIFK